MSSDLLSALASLPDEALVPVGWIRETLAEATAAEPTPEPPEPHIVPDQLYTPYETAELLRMEPKGDDVKNRKRKMENRVYDIDPRELIKTRMGAKGGRLVFWGRDILGFIEGRRQT